MGADARDASRRRFLKVATCALGGGIGAVVAVPALRYLVDPVGRTTVTSANAPIDVGAVADFAVGAPPRALPLLARSIRDAWSTVTDVPLGAAYLRRTGASSFAALSSVCPHLGCSVGFDGKQFRCPCHESAFDVDGARLTGPAERGLDPLPVTVEDGRVKIAWVRYRVGGSGREPT